MRPKEGFGSFLKLLQNKITPWSAMNREEFEGKWDNLKRIIQERWNKFTNDDLIRINGEIEQFLYQLQRKYGYSKEEAEREVSKWQADYKKSPIKDRPPFGGEEKPSEVLEHKRLLYEDKEPVYPPNPKIEPRTKEQESWDNKKKAEQEKRRKAG